MTLVWPCNVTTLQLCSYDNNEGTLRKNIYLCTLIIQLSGHLQMTRRRQSGILFVTFEYKKSVMV